MSSFNLEGAQSIVLVKNFDVRYVNLKENTFSHKDDPRRYFFIFKANKKKIPNKIKSQLVYKQNI